MSDTSLAIRESTGLLMPASVEQFEERKKRVDAICQRLMVPGVHWTIVGEWDEEKAKDPKVKKFLSKAGAEMFCTQFGLTPRFQCTETALPGGHREYRVKCVLNTHGGMYVGEAAGFCSTMESKYRYRVAHHTCPTCGQELRKSKQGGWYCWTKMGGCGATYKDDDAAVREQQSGRIENPDLADCYHAVEQMAHKRAHVAATRLALGLSDKYSQDEDIVEVFERPVVVKTKPLVSPDEHIIQDKCKYQGKTIAEAYRTDMDWVAMVVGDEKKLAKLPHDREALQQFWAVMYQADTGAYQRPEEHYGREAFADDVGHDPAEMAAYDRATKTAR